MYKKKERTSSNHKYKFGEKQNNTTITITKKKKKRNLGINIKMTRRKPLKMMKPCFFQWCPVLCRSQFWVEANFFV